MSAGLLDEFELMMNVGLGAETIYSFVNAFQAVVAKSEDATTMWHLGTVLPLAYHETSRRAISKRQLRSGLRSILDRDPANDIAQGEAVFNLPRRIRLMYPRTKRAINFAIYTRLIVVEDGVFLPTSTSRSVPFKGEVNDIARAAAKLGTWAGQLTAFEYFTILGVRIG